MSERRTARRDMKQIGYNVRDGVWEVIVHGVAVFSSPHYDVAMAEFIKISPAVPKQPAEPNDSDTTENQD